MEGYEQSKEPKILTPPQRADWDNYLKLGNKPEGERTPEESRQLGEIIERLKDLDILEESAS